MRKVAWTVLRLALTIGLLWYFVQVYVDPRTFLAIVERISIPLLLAYLAIVFASRWMQAVQTRHALAEAGVAVSSIEVLRSQLIASYYTMFVPGDLVGGGVTWYLLKEARGGGAMIATILIYLRLVFLVTAVPFAVAGMLMESRLHSMALLGVLAIVSLAAAAATAPLVFRGPAGAAVRLIRAFAGQIPEAATRILAALRTLGDCITNCASASPRSTVSVFSFAVLLHVLGAAGLWLAAVAADAAVPFHAFLWVWPLMIIVHMLPLSFGGLGIREITLVYVLERLYGTTAESVLLISMIALLATTLLGLAGGVWNSVSAANSGKSAE